MRVQALMNKKLPNGKVHNGCLRVDHQKSEVEGCMVDIYVLRFAFTHPKYSQAPVTSITSSWLSQTQVW